VVAAFLQISGIITVGTAFLWVAFGIGVVYLGVLAAAFALRRGAESAGCLCRLLKAVLVGILGTILVSVILLAVGITATSAISAILVGLLVFFLSLTLTGTACLIKCLADCGE
jgi:hypothetical protein